MTAEERERLNELCRKAQQEKDPDKFLALIQELNEFLEEREQILRERWKKEPA